MENRYIDPTRVTVEGEKNRWNEQGARRKENRFCYVPAVPVFQ